MPLAEIRTAGVIIAVSTPRDVFKPCIFLSIVVDSFLARKPLIRQPAACPKTQSLVMICFQQKIVSTE